jgi:phosphoglycerol transferase
MNEITENNFSKPIVSNFKPKPLHECIQENWILCLAGSILSFILANILLSGWSSGITPNLSFPFIYAGDGFFTGWGIQRLIEGWVWENDRSGYPFGSNFHDFPGSDFGSLLVLKILGSITGEYFNALNIYVLLSFPLAFVSAFIVQIRFGLNRYFATSSALLFAFLPFHFFRLAHLFYLFYFVIPIFFYYSFKIFSCENTQKENRVFNLKNVIAFFILLLISSFGVYYALFGMIVIAVGGIAGAFKLWSFKPLILSIIAIAIIAFGVFLNLAPSIINNVKNGPNSEVAVRNIAEAEIYGFKLAQLVLPRDDHRVPHLAAITKKYSESAPLINENRTATLGLFGSIGLFLAGCVLAANSAGRSAESRISFLALISLVLFLSGTIGGLGSLFAMTITSSIRGWNRISPFLSFSCLAIFFFILQNYLSFLRNSKALYPFAAFCILLIGIYDQTVPADPSTIANTKNRFEADRSFIQEIERNIESNSPIYQLPYMPFPESPPINSLGDYELGLGFVHSKTLRWSYGGMKGRPGDLFYRELGKKPISEQLPFIKKLGFKGIYVDRRGFSDNAKALENDFYTLLPGAMKREKSDKTAFFIALTDTESPDFSNLTPSEVLAKIDWGVLKPGMRYTHGQTDFLTFQSWSGAEKEHRWSLGKRCSIEFVIDSLDDFQGELILDGNSYSKQKVDILLNNTLIKSCDMDGSRGITSVQFSKSLLKQGSNKLTLLIPGAQKPDNGDPREVGFALKSITIK